MTNLPLGLVITGHEATRRELHSALPHAPVVPEPTRRTPRLRRTRLLTASALRRAATRLAPSESLG